MKKGWMFAAAALMTWGLQAKVTLAPPFRDNAVLQRGCAAPVWGGAEPGETVTVEFAGQKLEATADAAGKWRTRLSPLAACCEGRVLSARGKDSAVCATNLLVGEVWLCAGQSNMELPLWRPLAWNPSKSGPGKESWGDNDGGLESQLAAEPLLRLGVGIRPTWAPLDPRGDSPLRWVAATQENQKEIANFSAVGFHYGLELVRALRIPVGIINASWGGTSIEGWIPPCGYAAVPELGMASRNLKEEFKELYSRNGSHWPATGTVPTAIHNLFIHPLAPFAMRGAVWYQGENNLTDGRGYLPKLRALYKGWSNVFENASLKFRVVQLVPGGWAYGERLGPIWEAQSEFAAEDPNVGLVIANDLGDSNGDIHPRNKRTVGLRLAAMALCRDYGFTNLVCESPTLQAHRVENGRYFLSFRNAKELCRRGGWLRPLDDRCPFDVAGADGRFVQAKACITNGNEVAVWSDAVPSPTALRYLWNAKGWNGDESRLCNEAGLPLGAFRFSEVKNGPPGTGDNK